MVIPIPLILIILLVKRSAGDITTVTAGTCISSATTTTCVVSVAPMESVPQESLLALDWCRTPLPSSIQAVVEGVTQLQYSMWEVALQDHLCLLRSATRIQHDVIVQHPEPITEYVEKKLQLGRMLGPFPHCMQPSGSGLYQRDTLRYVETDN